MKVLLVGDAVVSSGFARCCHAAADALHAAGHEVHVLGINYFGDPHPYPYTIYPCFQPQAGGHEAFGTTRLPILAKLLSPDVICILQDPWNMPAYLDRLEKGEVTTPVVGWLAVDGRNQHGDELNRLAHVIAWTDFGAHELTVGGYTGSIDVVPLGVDLSVFRPIPRATARRALFSVLPPGCVPSNAYIVGVVGRNQPRKRLDLTLSYFAAWITSHEIRDAYLYLHVAPTGEVATDIASLVSYYKLTGRVILARPDMGKGDPTEVLPYLYSSFNVLFNTAQGEGWGLPTLEAMACGVPSIVPNWAAFDRELGWSRHAAYSVDCTSTALTAPTNGSCYTLGGIMDHRLAVFALNTLYRNNGTRESLIEDGLALAQTMPWSRTGNGVMAALQRVVDRQATVATPDTDDDTGELVVITHDELYGTPV